MRKDESSKVFDALQKYGLKLHVVDASSQFYGASTKIRKPAKPGESPEFYDSPILSQVRNICRVIYVDYTSRRKAQNYRRHIHSSH